jgi:hypothetical protein
VEIVVLSWRHRSACSHKDPSTVLPLFGIPWTRCLQPGQTRRYPCRPHTRIYQPGFKTSNLIFRYWPGPLMDPFALTSDHQDDPGSMTACQGSHFLENALRGSRCLCRSYLALVQNHRLPRENALSHITTENSAHDLLTAMLLLVCRYHKRVFSSFICAFANHIPWQGGIADSQIRRQHITR